MITEMRTIIEEFIHTNFFYKDNVYLLARHEKHTDITTYKMSKIRGVETTSLFLMRLENLLSNTLEYCF